MDRHVSFWIGFFAAAVIIVPVAVFAWGLAQERLFDLLAMVFASIVTLVVVLLAVLIFRRSIFQKILGRGEASIEEATRSLVASVTAAATGNVSKAQAEAEILARTAVGWYSWSNFYRWVIATIVGLLVAFATFTGSVLLFEQTKKIGAQTEVMIAQQEAMKTQTGLMEIQTSSLEQQIAQASLQNEILTLSLVSELREQLLSSTKKVSATDLLSIEDDEPWFFREDGSCGAKISKDMELTSVPSEATILAIAQLGREGALKERVVQALNYLEFDSEPAVAFGAMMVRDYLGLNAETRDQEEHSFRFDGLYVDRLSLNIPRQMQFNGSYVESMGCSKCDVSYHYSMLWRDAFPWDSDENVYASNSLVSIASLTNGEQIRDSLTYPHEWNEGVAPLLTQRSSWEKPAALIDWQYNQNATQVCDALRELALDNPFIDYFEGQP